MKVPALFIFDMDGLIFDSERLFMKKLGEVMKEYGYEMTLANYHKTLGLSMTDICKVMAELYGEDYPCMEITYKGRALMNEYAQANSMPVKEGIVELLDYLKEQNIPCCVASSSPRKTVEIYLRTAGLLPYFQYLMAGDELKHSKPNPEIFLTSCKHFDVAPEDAVVLEDSENGLKAAFAGNIPAICIPDMKMPAQELIDKTWFMAESAFDVLEKVKSMVAEAR